MSKPKISVILPVYNVGEYISETLDSLLNQPMIDDIEVIMVDDGSTDDSRYIIDRYALDYDNFHAYHKENEGQGIARNYGLEIARGEYIHFFDPDDYLPSDAYETLYGLALKNDCDITIGNALRFGRYHVWEDILFINSFKEISEDIDSTTLDEIPRLVWDTAVWNKLYKREFLQKNDITFPNEKIFFEDLLFTLETYILADSITITKDVVYYWRLRDNQSSVTQQDIDVRNFKDRLKILRLKHELLMKHDVGQNVADEEYSKWLNHDLKFFSKRFDHFPKENQRELFDEIYELVKLIPDQLIDNLNSYKKALYKMIQNKDFENFLLFAPLENNLYTNPTVPEFIDDKYKEYFDFHTDLKDEKLVVYLTDITKDESHILIDFDGNIYYLSGEENYEVSADFVFEQNEHHLEVEMAERPQIKVPLSLIRDNDHSQIKVHYKFGDFIKENFLKIRHRKSLEFDEFYMDLDMGASSYLYIDIRNKDNNNIEINNIRYDDGLFTFEGISDNNVSAVYVENIIDFDSFDYPVEYRDDGFSFEIPYNDLLNAPIKKWELNCQDSLNSIQLSKPFEFFNEHSKIRFINSRNKIFIENDVYDIVNELYKLNNENKDLKSHIQDLKDENRKLKNNIDTINKKINENNNKVSKVKSKIADKFKIR